MGRSLRGFVEQLVQTCWPSSMTKKTHAYPNWRQVARTLMVHTLVIDFLVAIKGYRALKGVEFWTSGTDVGCDGKNYCVPKTEA
jgi:hypothetical protein